MKATEVNDLAFKYVESKFPEEDYVLNADLFKDIVSYFKSSCDGNQDDYLVFHDLCWMWLKNKLEAMHSDIYMNSGLIRFDKDDPNS